MAAHAKKKVVKKKAKKYRAKTVKFVPMKEPDGVEGRRLYWRGEDLGEIKGDSLKFMVNGKPIDDENEKERIIDGFSGMRAYADYGKRSWWRAVKEFLGIVPPGKFGVHDVTEKAEFHSPNIAMTLKVGKKLVTVDREKWVAWYDAQDRYNAAWRLAEMLKEAAEKLEAEMLATSKKL